MTNQGPLPSRRGAERGELRASGGRLAHRGPRAGARALPALVLLLALAGCRHTVQVEAPKDPITINLNIKLDADVRLRVQEEAKKDVSTQPIF